MASSFKSDDEKKTPWLLYGVVACVLVTIVWALLPWSLHIIVPQLDESGQVGDTFGIVNALFTALAFALLIITAQMQRQELELQRKELVETRDELRKSAEAQQKLVDLTIEQLIITRTARRAQILPRITVGGTGLRSDVPGTKVYSVDLILVDNPAVIIGVTTSLPPEVTFTGIPEAVIQRRIAARTFQVGFLSTSPGDPPFLKFTIEFADIDGNVYLQEFGRRNVDGLFDYWDPVLKELTV